MHDAPGHRIASALLLAGLVLAGAPRGTLAQSAPAQGAIEEIVVTARKRQESVQSVPIPVTAFTDEMLQRRTISNLEDIGQATPSLLFDQNSSTYNPRVYIRGVGSDDALLTIDPGVGVYVDGVYLARTFALNLDVMDIERVEVLRGPQGTLYGRNTIGGAISLTSSQPSGTWGSQVRAKVGTQGQVATGAAIDFPMVDEVLSGRISLSTQYDEGYFNNTFGGQSHWNNDRGMSGRATFLLTPSETARYRLILDRTQKRSHPAGVNLNSVCEGASTNLLCTGGFNTNFLAPLAETSRLSGSLNAGSGSVYAQDTAPADRGDNDVDSTGAALISTFDLGEDTQLKLITSGRTLETRESLDTDATSISFFDVLLHNDNLQAAQEFQLGTKLLDGRIDWISGVYLFYEDTKTEQAAYAVGHDNAAFQAALGPSCGTSPSGVPISCFSAAVSADSRTDQTTRSYAGFTHMEYDLTHALQLEAGLRYTYDHKRFKTRATLKSGVVQTNRRDTEHWDDWSPMVGLNYQLTDDILLYARWSRGFRGGQFNGRANDANPITAAAVDPETVKVSEIGMKSSWADNRLLLNLAAFRNNYQDQQLTTFTFDGTRFVSLVQNAGKSRILGAELDLVFRPTNALTLFGSVSALNAKYQTFRETSLFPTTTLNDVSDRDFKNAPELSFNLGTEYTFPARVIDGWLTARLDYSHRSKVYHNTANTESIRQNKVGLLNGRVAWANDDETLEVALWGKNLGNREWDVFGIDFNAALGFTIAYPAPPLQAGLELVMRY